VWCSPVSSGSSGWRGSWAAAAELFVGTFAELFVGTFAELTVWKPTADALLTAEVHAFQTEQFHDMPASCSD
jgi:hypothetical protein